MAALGTSSGQQLALAPYATTGELHVGQQAALVVYGPPVARSASASQQAALVVYGATATPNVSQLAALALYRTGVPDPKRSRAWWFTLDGHTFYVLDLGIEGTYVYDTVTRQWSRWYTAGYSGMWNMKAGTPWRGIYAVAGDSITGTVWQIDTTVNVDESWKQISHVVTGGIMLRGRVYVGMSSLRLAGSTGQVLSGDPPVEISMRFSDDQGKTWSSGYPVLTAQGEFGEETAWRSLGSFMAPGRIIEISDVGGMLRIDGLDAQLDGFDEPPNPATGGRSG